MADNLGRPGRQGITSDQEIDPNRVRRAHVPLYKEFIRFLRTGDAGAMLLAMAFLIFVIPGIEFVFLSVAVAVFIYNQRAKDALPFFLPKVANRKDPHYPVPGQSKKLQQAAGITFFGNEADTGEEIWMPNDVLRQHILMLGTTGAGKTAGLVSTIVYSALLQGSGCIYVDGKGDVKLPLEIISLARRFGREDDVLVINYMTGNKDVRGGFGANKSSNTFNPFVYGSSSNISELLKSLLSSDSASKGDMWKSRAETFIDAMVRPLVLLRDYGRLDMNIGVFRNSLSLGGVAALMRQMDALRADMESDGERFPASTMDGLKSYLLTLPGLKQDQAEAILAGDMPSEINNTVLDQHGFITMQLTPVVNMLAEDFGFIFNVDRGEVDMWDVVVNRRILVVLLPALEKAPGSLANLGKIVLASLKSMMGMALGADIEGDTYITMKARPTNAPIPFSVIFDEVGYYFTPGMAITAAQGRSLGFSMIFGAQDLPAMTRMAKEEAMSTVANTNIKIVGRVEDPKETFDIIGSRVGEAYTLESPGNERINGEMGPRHFDQSTVSYQRRTRITIRDLARLRDGQVFMIYGDQVVRVNLFYADPKVLPEIRLNEFLEVLSPSPAAIKSMNNDYSRLYNRARDIAAGNIDIPGLVTPFTYIPAANMRVAKKYGAPPFEAALLGLDAFREYLDRYGRAAYSEFSDLGVVKGGSDTAKNESNAETAVRLKEGEDKLSRMEANELPDTDPDEISGTSAWNEDDDVVAQTMEETRSIHEADETIQAPDNTRRRRSSSILFDNAAKARSRGARSKNSALAERLGQTSKDDHGYDHDDDLGLPDSENGLGDRDRFHRRLRNVSLATLHHDQAEPGSPSVISQNDENEFDVDLTRVSAPVMSQANQEADFLTDRIDEMSSYPTEPTPQSTRDDAIHILDLLIHQVGGDKELDELYDENADTEPFRQDESSLGIGSQPGTEFGAVAGDTGDAGASSEGGYFDLDYEEDITKSDEGEDDPDGDEKSGAGSKAYETELEDGDASGDEGSTGDTGGAIDSPFDELFMLRRAHPINISPETAATAVAKFDATLKRDRDRLAKQESVPEDGEPAE